MIFAVLGGDARQAILARLLEADGHTARRFALGTDADLPTAAEAARDADCAVLPTPVCSQPGVLNAPLSETAPALSDVLAETAPDCPLVGGRVDENTAAEAARLGRRIEDVLLREELAVGNAVATAEGAVELLLRNMPVTLWRSRALVLGYGRIGRLLCRRLAAFGTRISAAARKKSDLAWIEAAGVKPLDIRALSGLERFDLIVNTVPARVLPESLLKTVRPDAVLLELASAPGGFDFDAAEKLGLQALRAPGLPGKTAPQTAAALLRDCIYGILEERHV